MPYSDGNPTLGEQIEEDAARRFYTDDLVKEGLELGRENDRLRQALVNLLERLDQHFGGSDSSTDWKEQEEAWAALSVSQTPESDGS